MILPTVGGGGGGGGGGTSIPVDVSPVPEGTTRSSHQVKFSFTPGLLPMMNPFVIGSTDEMYHPLFIPIRVTLLMRIPGQVGK